MYNYSLTQRVDGVKTKWHSVRLSRAGRHYVPEVLAHLRPGLFLIAWQGSPNGNPARARDAALTAMAGLNEELAANR